ncbi:MAG: hypothetical protein GY749_23550, partial [Desulfobacteraceae bacterium]|nr:hypothetical protein [Desulfobacteraceae bacterium]
ATVGTDTAALLAAATTAVGSNADWSISGSTLTYTGTGAAPADLDIILSITDDALAEGIEDYSIDISNVGGTASNVTLGTASASTDIAASDAVTVDISGDANTTEGSNANYAISVSGPVVSGETVTIDLGSTDGDATVGTDTAALLAAATTAVGSNADWSISGSTLTYTGTGAAPADLDIIL